MAKVIPREQTKQDSVYEAMDLASSPLGEMSMSRFAAQEEEASKVTGEHQLQ
jgi:hypothetical protein